jgi:hypothetical protein
VKLKLLNGGMEMKKFALICVLVGLMSAGAADAAVTLTFDELPTQPVDGLTYKGVTFGFTVGGSSSTDALYSGVGPGEYVTYLEGTTLEGNAAGMLTFDFAQPTNLLQFGLALNSFSPVTAAYTVELFDASLAALSTYSGNTYPLILWSEDLFTYNGAPISRAIINFNEQFAGRFAVDNLSINPSPAPAPGSVLLGSLGVGFVSWLRRRRAL